jgi:hypothetical protein
MLTLAAILVLLGAIWFSDDVPSVHRWKMCVTIGVVFAALDAFSGAPIVVVLTAGTLRGAVAGGVLWLAYVVEDANRGLTGSVVAMIVGVVGAALAVWGVPILVHLVFA